MPQLMQILPYVGLAIAAVLYLRSQGQSAAKTKSPELEFPQAKQDAAVNAPQLFGSLKRLHDHLEAVGVSENQRQQLCNPIAPLLLLPEKRKQEGGGS